MDRSKLRRLVGRILIVALLACIATYAVFRFRTLQDSQRPLQLLELDSYRDVTGMGDWSEESELRSDLKTSILNSYLKAWTAWNLALLGDEEQRLERHFSGPALHKIEEGLDKQAGLVVQKDRTHRLTLEFLSDDLTVVEFSDFMTVEREIWKDGKSQPLQPSQESHEVLMILQDGLWRVEQWKRSLPDTKE